MGGLIVGEMFAKYGVSPAIPHIITLGTPFLGSERILTFEAGAHFILALARRNQPRLAQIGRLRTNCSRKWPFVLAQNRVFPPIMSIYNGTYSSSFPALARSQGPNSALPVARALWQAENSVPPIPQAYAIIGSGQSTLSVLTDTLSQGNCLQGVNANGDGSVPLNSALGSSWVPSANVGFVNEQHLWLAENHDVRAAIFQILSGNAPTTLSQTPFKATLGVTTCEQ